MAKSKYSFTAIAALSLLLLGAPLTSSAQSSGAKILKKVPPEFPAEAARKRIFDGIVKARLSISGDGGVTEVTVTAVNPREARVFEGAAIEALNKWRFEPAGKAQTMDITLVFQSE